ncbi:Csu type fimbrial protein [Luteimonas aquatica]|uniref:Csu type fimbrial protein n=1 Tax=Luteimonas aquatica TaxID=450364 RepID=UPI001F5762D4|nr:spore coat U domain-containing protein [Luteimonas aquatica]
MTISASCLRAALSLLLLAAGAAWLPAASAATNCSATSSTLAFGNVSTSTNTDTSTTFTVTCSSSGLTLSLAGRTRVRLCLNIGDGAQGGGNFNPRRMTSTLDALQFQMYTDPARSQIWGSRLVSSIPTPLLLDMEYPVSVLTGIGSGSTTVTIYGRVPGAQTFFAGIYGNAFSGNHTSMDYRFDEPSLLGGSSYPASCTSGGDGGTSVNGAFPITTSARVPASCRAYATTDLDFGSVPGVIDSAIDQTSTIGLTCTGRTSWLIGLNDGQNASGGIRRMRQGTTANYVSYDLYQDVGRTQRWGNGGTDSVLGTGTGAAQTLVVYGRVPPAQAPAAGSYSDVITVTITY